jgi:hypothetical protein
LKVHLDGAFLAYGALVCCLHVQVVTCLVEIVAASYRHDCTLRVEQIFAAYWTVTFGRSLDTLVGLVKRNCNANVAPLAMNVVLAQADSAPADSAVHAMIDFLAAVVIPQLADIAVIPRGLCPAVGARVPCRLGSPACHAHHVLGLFAIQVMRLYGIVAVPTCVPSPALEALHLDIPLVMLASKSEGLLVVVSVLSLAIVCFGVLGGYPLRRGCVSRTQIERVLRVDFGSGGKGRGDLDFREDRLARSRSKGPFLGDEAVWRLRPNGIISLRHESMHQASFFLVGCLETPYFLNAGSQVAHAVVCWQQFGDL